MKNDSDITVMRLSILLCLIFLMQRTVVGQTRIALIADRVFDGHEMHTSWIVVVEDDLIIYAGPEKGFDISGVTTKYFNDATLMPGMIEGHAHMFLYPYNQTPWNDQVLKESESYRTARATLHARNTLLAGFTTVRDLGTEGAGYADTGLKRAIDNHVIPGPRLIISTRAKVATGSYGPKGFADHIQLPLGAEEADGHDDLIQVVRNQIGKGADFIKVYADYRWGPHGEAMPTFSQEELELIVKTAHSSGRYVVAHASTPEGMRRAILAGVETIEHGDGGTPEIWELMKAHNVALCPTLAAGDAILQYGGWEKGVDPEPLRIQQKRKHFSEALQRGVTIVAGGDVGVFEHGDNVRELEMMVDYGMKNRNVLRSVTSVNARVFHIDNEVGSIKKGMKADIIAVTGNPDKDITVLRNVEFVMKDGKIIKEN